jgi:hypothetical protein
MLFAGDPERRGAVVVGVLLVVIGLVALGARFLSWDVFGVGWPLIVVFVGLALFAAGVAVGGNPGVGFAIPGGIVTMTGLVLAFQAATDLWSTWAYAWALVAPGGVGLGMVLYGLFVGQPGISRAGIPPLLAGIGLFLGFGLFFEGVLGLNLPRGVGIETALAGGLVVLGFLVIAVSLVRRRGPV